MPFIPSAALLSSGGTLPFINVKDAPYRAKGDGVTDDRAAIQAAITYVAAQPYGGKVSFPAGNYIVGSPGLSIPTSQQQPVTLCGETLSGTGAGQGSQLKRTGAYQLLTAAGTGVTVPTICHGLTVRDLSFRDESGSVAALVDLTHCAAVLFENVRMRGSGSYALKANVLWNSRFLNCNFEDSGNLGSTIPAVLVGDDAAGGGSDTVRFEGCIWEANSYTDLSLHGGTNVTSTVTCLGCKWERSGGHAVHFGRSQYSQVIGGSMYTNNANVPVLASAGSLMNGVIGVNLGSDGAPTAPYLVQLNDGNGFVITGCSLIGSTTAQIRLDPTFTQATILGNTHVTLGSEVDVSDARTVKTGIVATRGQIAAVGAITTLTKAGTPTDSDIDFDVDGAMILDTSTNRLYVRSSGAWKYAALT